MPAIVCFDCEFFERLAAAGPVWLVLEDLHWADRISMELVDYLLPLAERVPLAIVGCSAPTRSWIEQLDDEDHRSSLASSRS